MTRDDKLFDISYVVFDVNETHFLIGKNVFVSDSLINLRDAVNRMDITSPCYYGQLLSAEDISATHAAFKIDSDDRTFKYIYYDPYYELKCAFKRGETIEYQDDVCSWRAVDDPVFNDKPEHYRIKQNKPVLKWQDIKIGDIVRGPLFKYIHSKVDDFCGVVTLIDMDTSRVVDKHICVGNIWIEDKDICKLRRVNAAGEDIE